MVLLQETETALESLHFIFFSFCPLSVTFLRVKIFIMLFLSMWLSAKEKERKKRGREKENSQEETWSVCLVEKNEQEAWIVWWRDGGQRRGQKVEGCLWTAVYSLSPIKTREERKGSLTDFKGRSSGGMGGKRICVSSHTYTHYTHTEGTQVGLIRFRNL